MKLYFSPTLRYLANNLSILIILAAASLPEHCSKQRWCVGDHRKKGLFRWAPKDGFTACRQSI